MDTMIEQDNSLDGVAIAEMNGHATPDEIAYLRDHFLEHRAALLGMLHRNQSLIVRLRAEESADTFHEHELELKSRIAKTGKFLRSLEKRISELNTYGKSHPEAKNPALKLTQDEYIQKKIALARLKGWGEAIRYFNAKLEEGLTREQAMDACIKHACSEHNKLKEAYANKAEPGDNS